MSLPWSLSHPLAGAHLRFERADIHLAEADRIIREFSLECEKHIVAHDDPHTGGTWVTLDRTPALPVMLPLVVSDAIHNLRAALDYIVYELARLDAGEVVDGTQFLIENSKHQFEARSQKHLRGLSPSHVAAIEGFQPYNRVEWTKTLRDISNPDKHRTLTTLSKESGRYSIVALGGLHRFHDGPGVQLTREGVSDFQWQVDASNAISIAPADSSKPSLMETLRHIELEVCRTIELFKHEF